MEDQHAIPTSDAILNGFGDVCADLTPKIKKAITPLQSGQVLEVVSNDPVAREGVSAWSRLTGNPLIHSIDSDDNEIRFFIRKK